jgi:pimeloyl-ACP methyl ester carboxylesterase
MAATLHTTEWGTGDRVVILVHGMIGSTEDWWEVAPRLAERGYRVVGVDLPGHGCSAADDRSTLASTAAALVRSVPERPALAMGHSLGGLVLAAAVADLDPDRAVYVESPFRFPGAGDDLDALAGYLAGMKEDRTADRLRTTKPNYGDRDVEVMADAAGAWDVTTTASLVMSAGGRDLTPGTGRPSLVVRAEPSSYIPPEEGGRLRALGFTVRDVPGAGHSVWFGHVPAFLAALDGWV